MLTWEFPPKSIGGLAQHVYDLTRALTGINVEVHVLTCGAEGVPEYEQTNKVHIHRVNPYNISSMGFVNWVTQLNIAMLEKAIPIMNSTSFDIVHAHDWLVSYAGRALKASYNIPLVSTIHATEWGRNYGLHNDTQRHISDMEWWLTYESWKVICCSHYMKDELRRVFQIPEDKLCIIPNGVDPENFAVKKHKTSRENYAANNEKIVFYVGRLVREKGVEVLLNAAPKVLSRNPNTKFVIAGKGPHMETLRHQATQLNIAHHVYFTGYIDDEIRNSLYNWADVAVFPSLYEPFGIVALEGMAARTPVIVSDTGGLSEIVIHGTDGLKFYPGNSNSLADMILKIFYEPGLADRLEKQAFLKVKQYFNWQGIARNTAQIYREVLDSCRNANLASMRSSWFSDRFSRIFNKYH